MIADTKGLVLCSRYSFAPNSLHYCGPERQNDMLGYVKESAADGGLAHILHRFETLYPYLVLIASENHITDPFDPRVVEAYWLGNRLLGSVHMRSLVGHLEDTAQLKKKLSKKKFTSMMDEVVIDGVPQHNFHVFNVYVRTGHLAIPHTLTTMDQCRISWGKVKKHIDAHHCIVSVRPLVYLGHTLQLGLPEKRTVTSIITSPIVGEWVSVHWGYICDRLTARQRMNLAYYTARALGAANRGRVID